MKRLLILLAGLFAALGLTAATAGADPVAYTLSLQATPATIEVGGTTTLAVALQADPATTDVSGYDVFFRSYSDDQCTIATSDVGYLTTGSDGTASGSLPLWGVRTYYFDAAVYIGESEEPLYSNCVGVTVTMPSTPAVPTVPSHPSSYLCWNREMVDPVTYTDTVADAMWATGNYFEPQAILGNVADGTNIGAYHLVCNAPSTMTITEYGLGGSGEVYSPEAMAAYHHDHLPATGNDLNVYHIWK